MSAPMCALCGVQIINFCSVKVKARRAALGAYFDSALAGSLNVLPLREQKTTRYAGEIKSLSKERHLSDIMTSVQAVKKAEER